MVHPSGSVPSTPRFTVIQDGARLHYAIPIALQRAGMLERVYTDWYALPGWRTRLFRWGMSLMDPSTAARMQGRYAAELDSRKVHASVLLALRSRLGRRRFAKVADYYKWQSQLVGSWVNRKGFEKSNVLFGFIRNIDPSLCRAARERGLWVLGDQIIAPYAVERREEVLQHERFPGWAPKPKAEDVTCQELEEETWRHLDHISCASEYVREGLMGQGVSSDRISVIPYPLDASQFPVVDRRGRSGPVIVGFVGAVGLRKGAPYFLEVARRFDSQKVKFVMVGSVGLDSKVLHPYEKHVTFTGAVAPSEVLTWLKRFDIFLFPSTCEGSAGAVMEAMATGLPVIASPNSGSIIQDGVDGSVIPYDNVDAIVSRLSTLVDNPSLRIDCGMAAAASAAVWSPSHYGQALKAAMTSLATRQFHG